jgi:hypothetical protein
MPRRRSSELDVADGTRSGTACARHGANLMPACVSLAANHGFLYIYPPGVTWEVSAKSTARRRRVAGHVRTFLRSPDHIHKSYTSLAQAQTQGG